VVRAGSRCEHYSWIDGRCRQTEGLQAGHIHPHSRGGATDIPNGQALCRRHNKQKSDRVPSNWQWTRLARRREGYFPPGIPTVVV
jgi:5-methylcytosine-specific restriction endonuclease McrA